MTDLSDKEEYIQSYKEEYKRFILESELEVFDGIYVDEDQEETITLIMDGLVNICAEIAYRYTFAHIHTKEK